MTVKKKQQSRRKAKAVDVRSTQQGLNPLIVGVRGKTPAFAQDFMSNLAARTGFGSTSLQNGTSYAIERWTLNWWSVLSIFESSFVARRVVTGISEDILKAWPKVLGETKPKDLVKLDTAVRRTATRNRVLSGIELGRLYGGAGALIMIKGHEKILDKPLDFDDVELGSYAGLQIFDRWSGVWPGSETCDDPGRPLDFGDPEFYECQGKEGASFKVHSSRILRFTGPMMPEPEKSAYQSWGISVLAPIVQAITSYDNVSQNALSLTFRAQIIGMKQPDLAAMLSGLGGNQSATTQYFQRMSQINEMLSNQNMVLLPEGGELSKIEYSFGGLSELIQMFQLQVASAAEMPVAMLWGRTLNGLGNTGEGDEKVYSRTIATKANTTLRPALEKLYPIIFASELGEVPKDMDLYFPSIRDLDEKEKSDLSKTTADTLTVYLNSGVMSPQMVAKELKQSSEATGLGTNMTDEFIATLSDKVQAEGELGEGLFGAEGAETLDPASSPVKALKETDKLKSPVKLDKDEDDVQPVETDESKREKVKAADAIMRRLHALEKARTGDNDGPQVGPMRTVHGMPVVIETPKGYPRHGKGWSTVLPYDYGYFVDVPGADGDSLDVALNPVNGEDAGWVYVIDQKRLDDSSKFDESKCFVGYPSAKAALDAFHAGHHRAKDVFMDWTPLRVDEFKNWVKTHDMRKPCGE